MYSSRQDISVSDTDEDRPSCRAQNSFSSASSRQCYRDGSNDVLSETLSSMDRPQRRQHESKDDNMYASKEGNAERNNQDDEKEIREDHRSRVTPPDNVSPSLERNSAVKDHQGMSQDDQRVDIDTVKTTPSRSRRTLGMHSVSTPVLTEVTSLVAGRKNTKRDLHKASRTCGNFRAHVHINPFQEVHSGGASQSLSSLASNDVPTYRTNSFNLAVASSTQYDACSCHDAERPCAGHRHSCNSPQPLTLPGPITGSIQELEAEDELGDIGGLVRPFIKQSHPQGHVSTSTGACMSLSPGQSLARQKNMSKSLSQLHSRPRASVERYGSFSSVASWDC